MEEKLEDISEIKHTWYKVAAISKKTGLREGISDGRESCFQKYFDIGFREGFQNGFILGKYKGALVAHSKQNNSEVVVNPLLEKTSRGGCEVCKNEELLEEDVSAIILKQTNESNKYLKELHSSLNKSYGCKLLEGLNT